VNVQAPARRRLADASVAGDTVTVRFADGSTAALHRFLLRDGCLCPACRHPLSGQRLFESHHVVPDAELASAHAEDGLLVVEWADGHSSAFDQAWLEDALAGGPRRPRPLTLWGAELADRVPVESFAEVVEDDRVLHRWLDAIAEYGFALVTGVPAYEGAVAEVAELFGHVRVTNYGRIFDVAVRVDATNLADTALALSLHTDNPYRDPTPTLQLLHCLASSVEGGETVLADGFRAVGLLSAQSRELLASHPVPFAYRDATAELSAEVPVVSLDAWGSPVALHLNNRSKGEPAGPPELVAAWYAAYFELLDLLAAPEAQVVFRMRPGDAIVFDNLRVLHARLGFSSGGERRLQGCYADRDSLLSTLAVLERKEPT
jgi:gamma-butyrobetaine dioxygenase